MERSSSDQRKLAQRSERVKSVDTEPWILACLDSGNYQTQAVAADIKSIGADYEVKNVDWISKLPDDVLLLILSRLSTEEAIRTSVVSKRWKHVWKQMPHLVFDMQRTIKSKKLRDGSNRVDTLMTKVINNHYGHLESCEITHFSYQGLNGMLNTWIRSLTCVKHTKVLTLRRYIDIFDRERKVFCISLDSFSHRSLTSLSLHSYVLKSSDSLINCSNLRTLKLILIMAPEVGVFNRVLESCPCLEVLVLNISCFIKSDGVLKIDNNKLKLLQVSSMEDIDGIKVSATSLDILTFEYTTFERDGFFMESPQLKFNRNFWDSGRYVPHISYNISKEEKSIGHEELVKISGELLRPRFTGSACLSVSVDLMNRTQVERLRQVLGLWTHKMTVLEIVFKNNSGPREENESCQKKLWKVNSNEDDAFFPNAKFRVKTVWLYNFSASEEEFVFASCLIRQGTVLDTMMVECSSMSYPASKQLKIEAAVAKLQALQWMLAVHCF
ncbi:F-box protein [Cardamine amara subsp. amara]|uniref:F-box protein n=1 Tax=Cardamine amara subsp. amara TaxID=228776 RepID=A0ABD1AQF7_CARAN